MSVCLRSGLAPLAAWCALWAIWDVELRAESPSSSLKIVRKESPSARAAGSPDARQEPAGRIVWQRSGPTLRFRTPPTDEQRVSSRAVGVSPRSRGTVEVGAEREATPEANSPSSAVIGGSATDISGESRQSRRRAGGVSPPVISAQSGSHPEANASGSPNDATDEPVQQASFDSSEPATAQQANFQQPQPASQPPSSEPLPSDPFAPAEETPPSTEIPPSEAPPSTTDETPPSEPEANGTRDVPTTPDEPMAPETPPPSTPHAEPPAEAPDMVPPLADGTPFEIVDHTSELSVMLRRSKLLRSGVDIYRTAVVEPQICDVIQFTPREVSVIGRSLGSTHVTFWFEDGQRRPLTVLVRVVPDTEVQKRRIEQYQILEEVLSELFPDSKVRLTPVADKLVVRGQARDAEEAAQIMSIIRGQAIYGRGAGYPYGTLFEGAAADPLVGQDGQGRGLPASQVINLLRIPGEQQVALKVKIAELNRSAARAFGVDLNLNFSDDGKAHFIVRSLLNGGGENETTASLIGRFGNAANPLDVELHYLEQEGIVRILSEPTLVTLSGRAASFVAGGEFAVPTVVGVGGASAVTTDFRSFGAIISFLPVVLDKDRIRLEVSPEFSQVNEDLAVQGTPGLDTRAVTTTVEMREGQTLVIAGLLDESLSGSLSGDIPLVRRVLGMRSMTKNETELVILVTPELVHAMEPEEMPPLPGFDVTEPTNSEFFLQGKLEGKPTREYRSTVWPRLRSRYRSGGSAMISGPFGHGQ